MLYLSPFIQNIIFKVVMNLKNLLLFIVLSTFSESIFAQDYHPPLDFKMLLSGTFGELRGDHFHAGIDIKTEGVEGQKVYAIANGYISRIKISTWGYGKVLYITQADGNTSVYAHLKIFSKEINDYVIKNQYKKESFEIQLYPPKDKFVIKKGEVIALSGNTGGSTGAHLHFEIRDTKTERPINPLQFDFDIADDIHPIINKIKMYAIDGEVDGNSTEKSFSLKKNGGQYTLGEITPLVKGKVAFSISTYDKLNGAYNKNGVYAIKLLVDSNLIYHFQMDEFSFAESRFINAHIDYKEQKISHTKYHRCYKLPNNKLSVYQQMLEKEKVDVIFHPSLEEVYPVGYETSVKVDRLSGFLCGASRPYAAAGWTAAAASARSLRCSSCRTPSRRPNARAREAKPTVSAMMNSPTILASSRRPIPGEAYSSANSESVLVSREAIRMMLLVVPAATTKFNVPSRISDGINSGIQILK